MTSATATAIERVLEDSETAYMHEDYGPAAWRRIASFLLKEGHTEGEAVAIMRSKHARWADDSQGRGIGKGTNSAAFIRYYRAYPRDWKAEAKGLEAGTL